MRLSCIVFIVFPAVSQMTSSLLKSLPVFVCVPLPGSCVHVLRLPPGPLGPAGVQPVLSEELLTLPPPAPSPGLEVPQLHFHAHWVSSLLAFEFVITSSSPCCRFWGHGFLNFGCWECFSGAFRVTWTHPLQLVRGMSCDERSNMLTNTDWRYC